jgi:hypothetical protein
LKSLRITPLQFDILDLRVEKTENSEGRGTNRALFPFWGGLMAKALFEKLGLYGEFSGGEADPEGDVESEESQPAE